MNHTNIELDTNDQLIVDLGKQLHSNWWITNISFDFRKPEYMHVLGYFKDKN